MLKKFATAVAVFVITIAAAHAAPIAGGGEVENFKAVVKTGAVTQVAIGKNNTNELLIGSARAGRIKNFKTTVTTGAITQVGIGSGNNNTLLIGAASFR